MIAHALAVVTALLLLTPTITTAAGSEWAQWTPADSIDLANRPLDIDPSWQSGVLQVRLWRDAGFPDDWRMTLRYGRDAIELTAANSEARIVGSPDTKTRVLEILLPAGGKLEATRIEPSDLHILIRHVAYRQPVISQQLLTKRGRIDPFDSGVDAEDKAKALAFGMLELQDAGKGNLGWCTGFRLVQGIWLTAGHCLALDPARGGKVASLVIHPSDYPDGALESVPPFTAIAVATGQELGLPRADQQLRDTDLDYALLEARKDPGGEAFPFVPGDEAITGHDPLKLFMHWPGPAMIHEPTTPKPGKARSADDICRVVHMGDDSDPAVPFVCPRQIQHGCSSAEIASGSPLLLRDGLRLIGVHYGQGASGSYNCAVRASLIRKHIQKFLCSRRNDIARRIVPCP